MEGISCGTWGYRKWNLDDAVVSIAKIGYKGVERNLDLLLMPTSYSKTFLSKIGLILVKAEIIWRNREIF